MLRRPSPQRSELYPVRTAPWHSRRPPPALRRTLNRSIAQRKRKGAAGRADADARAGGEGAAVVVAQGSTTSSYELPGSIGVGADLVELPCDEAFGRGPFTVGTVPASVVVAGEG